MSMVAIVTMDAGDIVDAESTVPGDGEWSWSSWLSGLAVVLVAGGAAHVAFPAFADTVAAEPAVQRPPFFASAKAVSS